MLFLQNASSHLFCWVLNTPLLPVKNKETLSYMKNLTFMASFYGWGSTISRLQGYCQETFIFHYSVLRSFWYSFNQFNSIISSVGWKARITLILKPPNRFESRNLDWESSALNTRIIEKTYLKCKCRVFINITQTLHCKVAIQ